MQESLPLQRVSSSSARSVKDRSADACIVSTCSEEKPTTGPPTHNISSKMCCSKGKSVKQVSLKSNPAGSCCTDDNSIQEALRKKRCSSSCCSGNKPTTVPSDEVKCTKSCHSLENSAKHPAAGTGSLEVCRSENLRIDESASKVGCFDSNRPGDHPKDNEAKSTFANLCCLKTNPTVEPPGSACAGLSCGTRKNTITTEPLVADSSGPCRKSSKQDILQTPKTSCAGSCCAEIQPVSPQGSCADACCSSVAPAPGSQIDKTPIQKVDDMENQGTGKE